MMLVDEALSHARQYLKRGNAQGAAGLLFQQACETGLAEREYSEVLEVLAEALQQMNLLRGAASIALFKGLGDRAMSLSAQTPVDMARAAALGNPSPPNPKLAAQHYRTARWPAHAAIMCEKAQDWASARGLWEEVSGDPRLRQDPYVAALVSFNLGRVLNEMHDNAGAYRCRVRAMRLLEEAADNLEARGLRDRAFDCFQVLLTLGQETGSFENLAEGYVNCIRILREDDLKYYALQYYEDFARRAHAAGEMHAVATMMHECADYARALGMEYHPSYRVREAEAWQRSAEQTLKLGGAPELAENALLAAMGAFSSAGLHGRAVQLFRVLAALPLEEKRNKRYTALSSKYAGARDEESEQSRVPEFLKSEVVYPQIWNVDVIEWEEAGDPSEACAEVMLDPEQSEFIRRRALVGRLEQQLNTAPNDPATLARVAVRLGDVQVYGMLAPLEALYDRGRPQVREAVLQAARRLFFKRTFVLIQRGVNDPEASVRRAAHEAINALHFPHAFDPLQRLHREAADPDARRAALVSIGRVQSLQAVEYLIGVLSHGTAEERELAVSMLRTSEFADTPKALNAAIERETGEVLRRLREIRAQRNDR